MLSHLFEPFICLSEFEMNGTMQDIEIHDPTARETQLHVNWPIVIASEVHSPNTARLKATLLKRNARSQIVCC